MDPVQSVAPVVLAEVIRRQPASAARTAFAWSIAAGPAMARAAAVQARDGVLLVTPKDARWSREIQRSLETLLPRLQLLLGKDAITAIVLVPV